MNDNQINLLRVLYNEGCKKTNELGHRCFMDNGRTAHQLLQLRDRGYVVADSERSRNGGFATWTITRDGDDWMHRYIREQMVDPTLSPEQVINNHLQASLAALRADFTQVSDKLRAEKSINGELNVLIRDLRAKLSAATTVAPVSKRHFYAVLCRGPGSVAGTVIGTYAYKPDAIKTAELHATQYQSHEVVVCESTDVFMLEKTVSVKAVAKPI